MKSDGITLFSREVGNQVSEIETEIISTVTGDKIMHPIDRWGDSVRMPRFGAVCDGFVVCSLLFQCVIGGGERLVIGF